LLLILGLANGVAAAQQDSLFPDSVLREAVRLVTEGQGDSARALVRSRLSAWSPQDSLYPSALFAAAVVAQAPESALTYLRRVSIEYSRSRWAPAALLRLAQYAFARGDLSGALRSAERVLLDYPASGERAAAAYWAGRSQLELGNLPEACQLFQRAEADAGLEVEVANRARFYLQRCRTAALRDTGAVRPGSRVGFSVQVAAVQSPVAADEVMRSLRARGYEPRVIRDSDGLFKVRVGQFRSREEAQRLAAELRRALGGNPFVVEER
jgi:tetratricopeptide (TPR) repeat protein